jgi:hypothetical protein
MKQIREFALGLLGLFVYLGFIPILGGSVLAPRHVSVARPWTTAPRMG